MLVQGPVKEAFDSLRFLFQFCLAAIALSPLALPPFLFCLPSSPTCHIPSQEFVLEPIKLSPNSHVHKKKTTKTKQKGIETRDTRERIPEKEKKKNKEPVFPHASVCS